MKLDNKELYDLFVEKEISYLYHANTVATSITFIEEGGLLSRGAIENRGLYQTSQSSDEKDKQVGVWNDIFLDTFDLHEKFVRSNYYGPVLFKFSIDFLLDENCDISVTKGNPIDWEDPMEDNEKYFVSVQELKDNWDKYEVQKKMVTIKNQVIPILFDYVEQVIVDDPRRADIHEQSKKAIKALLGENHLLKEKFVSRVCSRCNCTVNYQTTSKKNLEKLFLPKER